MMVSFRWRVVSILGWMLHRFMPQARNQPERKRVLYVCEHELPAEVFALVRLTWHQQGKANRVDELVLLEDESMMPGFKYEVDRALKAGADVSIQTQYEPASLGLFHAER